MQQKTFRTLLFVGLASLMALLTISSCTSGKRWSEQQRHEARQMLRQWREIAYLNALTEEEFELFATNVTDLLEEEWPSYVEFIQMPMVGDSVEMVVVATIVTEIKASPEKLRHIFSYPELIEASILPEGMTLRQQHDFYKCFAERVNTTYGSMQQFIWDAIYSRLNDKLIAQMMRRCAEPYWDVDVTIVEVD